MIDHVPKSRRPLPEELLHQPEQSENPAQAFALEQEVARLRQAVAKLPDDQRLLIEHAYLGELSHSEIKDLTGLPLGTVKSRIRLGLDRLRHALKELRET
jgi:RNA polymerase sigma-70 factor (ECF subfamily)